MAWTWKNVTLTPNNSVAELENYFQTQMTQRENVNNLRINLGMLESMLQFDFREGKIYHYGFDHRPAIKPIQDAIKSQFPKFQFVDISGKQRNKLAHDPTVDNYIIREPTLTESTQALDRINKYRELSKGLSALGMFGNKPQNKAPVAKAELVSQKTPAKSKW